MVKQLDIQGTRAGFPSQGSEEKFRHIEAPGYSSEILLLPIIPHICHGRADGVRVNFFWPV